jgi:hypothetical protein
VVCISPGCVFGSGISGSQVTEDASFLKWLNKFTAPSAVDESFFCPTEPRWVLRGLGNLVMHGGTSLF